MNTPYLTKWLVVARKSGKLGDEFVLAINDSITSKLELERVSNEPIFRVYQRNWKS